MGSSALFCLLSLWAASGNGRGGGGVFAQYTAPPPLALQQPTAPPPALQQPALAPQLAAPTPDGGVRTAWGIEATVSLLDWWSGKTAEPAGAQLVLSVSVQTEGGRRGILFEIGGSLDVFALNQLSWAWCGRALPGSTEDSKGPPPGTPPDWRGLPPLCGLVQMAAAIGQPGDHQRPGSGF